MKLSGEFMAMLKAGNFVEPIVKIGMDLSILLPVHCIDSVVLLHCLSDQIAKGIPTDVILERITGGEEVARL